MILFYVLCVPRFVCLCGLIRSLALDAGPGLSAHSLLLLGGDDLLNDLDQDAYLLSDGAVDVRRLVLLHQPHVLLH